MEKNALLLTCAEQLIEIIPLLRGSVNAHIHSELNRNQWVTPGQTRLLYLISQGATSISELSAQQKTSAPTISRQVDCLVEKGLALRERKRADRRVVFLALTARGEEILGQILKSTQEWAAAQLAGLEESQLEEITRSLDALRAIFSVEKKTNDQSETRETNTT